MTTPITILQQNTIAGMGGDWTGTIPFNQFDPSSGAWLDTIFTTAGTIDTSASIENLSPVAANVLLNVSASIVATAPDIGVVGSVGVFAGNTLDFLSIGGNIVDGVPVNLGAFQGAFDGDLDFGGPSGTVLPELSGSQTEATEVGPGTASASPFFGTGTFDVGVSSHATSAVYGNGNLAVLLHSTTGADVSVEYDAAKPSGGSGGYGGDYGSGMTIGYMIGADWGQITTVPQVVILPSQTTGWVGTAPVLQFDPSLGTLEYVVLNVGNVVAGTFSAENLESVAGTVAMTESATMKVAIPGNAGITATAVSQDTMSLGGFDGSADFTGPSGQSDTISGPGAPNASSQFDPNSNLTLFGEDPSASPFIGTGTVDLAVSTTGASTVTGPANLLSEITQHTGGSVTVSYVYDASTGTRVTGSESDNSGAWSPVAENAFARFGPAVLWADNQPRLMFIGGLMKGVQAIAQSNETFQIGSGAAATIADYSPTGGDALDLTVLLAGVSLTPDLSNLGSFLSVTGYAADPAGGSDTTLSIKGLGGGASLILVNASPIAVADLLNDDALILPAH